MQRSFLGICVIGLFPALLIAQDHSPYKQVLAKNGVAVSPDGLGLYLRQLPPGPEQAARAEELIEQLGKNNFLARDSAMRKLATMYAIPKASLAALATGDDPELRWRAQSVLDLHKATSRSMFYAVLKVIVQEKTPGIASEILAVIPLCDVSYLKTAVREAVEETARREDAEVLRKNLSHEAAEVRGAAALAMARALGEEAGDDLRRMLTDKNDHVKLSAARALAGLSDRQSLPTLWTLLASDDPLVRAGAVLSLRQLSGTHCGFAPYDTAAARATAATKWKDWVDGEGATAELRLPLKKSGTSPSYLGGNTLLAYGRVNKVIEFDPAGKAVWSRKTKAAMSAEKMANGSILVAEHDSNQVSQFDRQGKSVWQFSCPTPVSAKPLDNGNILIASFTGNRVIEVSPDKRIVWQYRTTGNCSDAYRLPNGNTMLACRASGVIEVDALNKTVWKYSAPYANSCQPLPGGNVLIADSRGHAIEVTRAKKVVWKFDVPQAANAFRLPSGNTLITGASDFTEVTHDKRVVWTQEGCGFGTARR